MLNTAWFAVPDLRPLLVSLVAVMAGLSPGGAMAKEPILLKCSVVSTAVMDAAAQKAFCDYLATSLEKTLGASVRVDTGSGRTVTVRVTPNGANSADVLLSHGGRTSSLQLMSYDVGFATGAALSLVRPIALLLGEVQ